MKIEKFSLVLDKKETVDDFHVYLTQKSFPKNIEEIREGFIDLGKLQTSGNMSYEANVEDIYPYNAIVIYNIKTNKIFAIASLQYPLI
ncbi:MAG: hypothetical protein QW331_02185 [Candidatus Woesearchaeota archaeon]